MWGRVKTLSGSVVVVVVVVLVLVVIVVVVVSVQQLKFSQRFFRNVKSFIDMTLCRCAGISKVPDGHSA